MKEVPTPEDRAAAEREAGRLSPAPPVPAMATQSGGVRGLLRTATIDLTPLRRHRDFRLLMTGQTVTFLGSMVTYVALPYQAYELSGSSLVVGLLGVAELLPLLIAAFLGGALADARDRRRMLQLTELSFAVASLVLLGNSLLPKPQLWVLFAVSAVMAALDGLQRPSLEALIPRLVDREEMTAAAAISTVRFTVGMIVGPALGGVLIAVVGLPATYGVDLISFLVSLATLRLMRAAPPPVENAEVSLRSIREGIGYAVSSQVLMGTYVVDIVAMFFGMPMALFPAFAKEFGGAGVLGLMYAAPAVGSLIATVTSGWAGSVHRHGVAICLAAAGWGAAIVLTGLAPGLLLVLLGLAAAGGADTISGIFRSTVWNQTIPDELRGRLAGIEQVSYSTGPLLGNVESGLAAALIGVRGAIISGGALCVVGVAVVGIGLPVFWRYDADDEPAPDPSPA
ncbi:MAG TPA: MFS transporter [Gaiellales bacterium]|nr:MFS transporter [Gaiellales bacterium]